MDDSTQAEIYVNRVKHIVHYCEDRTLQLRYKQGNVKLADAKRDFINAAHGYFVLSNEEGLEVDEAQGLFDAAVVCSILAKSGARKQRILAILVKDERAKLNLYSDLLNKMALIKVVRSEDVAEFEKKLDAH